MPNFDGTGPLKRGRVIGRGQGPCGRPAGKKSFGKNEKEPEQKTATTG